MSKYPLESYQYDELPNPPPDSFRIAEVLPGKEDDTISCLLHLTNWSSPLEYEAVSYAWGDRNAKATVICHGKRMEVTKSLHGALSMFRYQDRSRLLYADALWWVSDTSPSLNLLLHIIDNVGNVYCDLDVLQNATFFTTSSSTFLASSNLINQQH